MSMISKYRNFFHLLREYVKAGGKITRLEFSQIHYGSLLSSERILITGGSSGIGLAMAKKFVSEGANVIISGRDESKLKQAMEEISSNHAGYLVWDVSDLDVLKERMSETISRLGGLTCVVNNAAFLDHKRTDLAFYDKTMDTNLRAVYFICKETVEVFKRLNKDSGGKILNVSSINGSMSSTHPYYISKWGLNGLTRGFAKENAGNNIIVNAIAPGYCASSINYRDVEKNAYDERSRIKRIITPEDIAELATFLLSKAANGIVGQVITCDGGATL